MKFGWISAFGAGIVTAMLIPNVVYALKYRNEENRCTSRLMNVLEQAGRYACILLMVFPLLVWEFGFKSLAAMTAYLAGSAVLLAAYWIVFAPYMRRRTPGRAMALAVLPACIFLLCGLALRHWLLAGAALVFAAGHSYVTWQNAKARAPGEEPSP